MGPFAVRGRRIASRSGSASLAALLSLFAIMFFSPLASSFAQRITPVGGFHSSSETDAFAKKGLLEITSAPAPIAGLPGTRATITMSCTRQNYGLLPNLVGTEVIPDIFFNVAVAGSSIDVGLGGGGSFSVDGKVRFDDGDPLPFTAPASDVHHLEFHKEPDEDFRANTVLIGFPVSGTGVALRINLHEPKVADLIAQCSGVRDRILKARAEQDRKLDEQEKQQAAAAAQREKEHDEQQKRYQAWAAAEAADKKQQAFNQFGMDLTPTERGGIDQIQSCLTAAGLGTIPPHALLRQTYDNFMASPAFMPVWKQFAHRSDTSPDRKMQRLNLILKTNRPITAWAEIGANTSRNLNLAVGSFIAVAPVYNSCQSFKVYTRTERNPQPKTYIHTAGYSTEGEYWIEADALTYATDGDDWCKDHCVW